MIRFQSLWKRPTIYKTIVQIYFVISNGFVLCSVYLTIENYILENSYAPFMTVPMILVSGFVTVLSGISFILLCYNRKTGFYLSLFTLFILFFVLGMGVSIFLDTLTEYYSIAVERNSDFRLVIEYFTIGFSGGMFVSLYLAWLKIKWK